MNSELKHIRLPAPQLRAYLERAVANASEVTCEELDCSKSWARQKTKVPAADIIAMVAKSSFFHCSWREGVLALRVSHKNVDYFLWIPGKYTPAE